MHRVIRVILAGASAAVTLLAPTAGHTRPPAPTLVWTPQASGSFDFGTVAVGQTAMQTFTLTSSKGKIEGLTVTLSGSATFTKTSDGCSGTQTSVNAARKSCSVTVQYAPATAGQADSATLAVSSNKPAALASLALTGAGAGATTSRHLYWTGAGIGRADVDGQNADPSFITGTFAPVGVAVDAAHIYWTDGSASTIGRADLDGQNADPNFITVPGDPSDPYGVAVDSGHIYWANHSGFPNTSGFIGRADLDGQNVNSAFIIVGLGTVPTGVEVDSEHIYWTEEVSGSIGRADLDGQNATNTFITGAAVPGHGPVFLAVDAGHIYCTTNNESTIGRADLDGQNADPNFITDTSATFSVAVDSGHIYWTDQLSPIHRADLNGQNINPNFIPSLAFDLAVDAD
jgi:hypothetical protein